jgi:putrescine transport system substrate-binding protein
VKDLNRSVRRWRQILVRRPLLAFSLAALAATVSIPLLAATGDVVNVFSWTNYIDAKAIPSFEDKTHIKVNYDLMDSNDVLEAKLLAGKSGYDVVIPSMNFFGKQVEGGLYQPIPKGKLKNYGNLDPVLMKRLERFDPGNVYGVPYMWGTNGIAYNADKIKERMPNAPTDSWKLLFDPEVVKHFKDCGVALLDAGDTVVESALIYLGRNPDTENLDDLKAAIDVITKIQPYVRYFHSTSYVDDLANGEICLALGYSGDVLQATRSARKGVKINYYLPKEGAELWIDVMAIPKDAPHPDAAAKWIDHILDPVVVAGISNAVWYANPNKASKALLEPSIRDNPIVYPPEDVMARLVVVGPKSQRFVKLRNRAWTQAKAGG